MKREASAAPIADIELAHGRMYVAALRGRTDGLREEIDAGGPTHAQIDPDTSINIHTWDAALRAAGAAIDAADAVMAGEMDNAFCSVRPPVAVLEQGHGFLFFRQCSHCRPLCAGPPWSQAVAIVDFDVHGNGTENIVTATSAF